MSTAAPVKITPCYLFGWHDPVLTGKVLASVVSVLVIFKYINLFNVFFHIAYIGLLVSAAAEYVGKLVTGQGFVTKYKPTTKSVAKIFNESILPQIGDLTIYIEEEFNKIAYSHDIETTLKAAGASYILYKVTSWFSLFTLAVVAVVFFFSFPPFYQTYQIEIDQAVAEYTKIIKEKIAEITKLAHEKAAPHIDTLVKKTGPVGSFVQSKFPTRTAGSTVGESKTTFGTAADASSATTSGSSQFPNAPSTTLGESTFEDAVDQAKSAAHEAAPQHF
ncbi:Reticulon-domain-containing protein [Scheffersomyces amazonensis]|uniref:Reticulon-domain-containing protein n=1 Tax=Scheffersomyces amazonensis TaxID=1078765 RepID=UPI00315D1194